MNTPPYHLSAPWHYTNLDRLNCCDASVIDCGALPKPFAFSNIIRTCNNRNRSCGKKIFDV